MPKKRLFSNSGENVLKKRRKNIIFLLFSFFMLQVNANSYAQNKRISLNVTNQTLKSVLDEIESQSRFNFIYRSDEIDIARKVSLNVDNENIARILEILFQGSTESYSVKNRIIVLKKIKKNSGVTKTFEDHGDLPIPKVSQYTVNGTVADENGAPLPGANILEKGTTNGVVSDFDGNFTIAPSNTNATLVVSYIGYETKEIKLSGETTISFQLTTSAAGLDEVVVVGFGTQNKRDVTGAIATVKFEDVKELAVASPEALLQGKSSGIQVVQNSGTPGGEIFVRIRGTASLLGESRPLYVVDGVPLNNSSGVSSGGERRSPLADINPNDIESMEILKDAAATAIYGSRGSNGVVLITTKRGKSGKGKVNIDYFSGIQTPWRTLDLLNGAQFVDVLTEGLTNRDPNLLNNPPFNQLQVSGANTNYQDAIFRSAVINNLNVSVSGGNERMNSFVSASYFNQQGTIIGQEFKRYSIRLNLDYQVTDKLKVGTSTTLSNTLQNRIETGFSGGSVLANALIRNPNIPVFNPDGSYSIDPLRTENPVLLANEVPFEANTRRVVTNMYGEYKITDKLTFKSIFGVDYTDDRQNRFSPSFVVANNGVSVSEAFFLDEQTIINDNTLSYSNKWKDHKFSALLGFGFQESTFNNLFAGGRQTGTDLVQTIGAVADPFIPGQNITSWGLLSYFGRFNYSFKDKYLIEGSARIDGSSRFGSENRYGVFPGVSVGWRLSEEPFLKDSGFISDLKLRSGIGVTGNQDGIGNFAAQALYFAGRNYDGNPGIGQGNIPNLELGWESTTSTNIGLDLAILNGRFSLTADAYEKRTDNLIFAFQLPWTSGFGSIGNANIGEMKNRGLELALNANILTGDFKWSTNFNISFNDTEITKLPENGSAGSDFVFKLPDAFGIEGPTNIYRVGESVGSFYGYVYDGVYATDADVPQALFDRGLRAGDARFVDLNDDGVFDRQNDRQIIGNAIPKHIGGFSHNFSYKGIELSALFNWSYGNDIYNMTGGVLSSMSEEYNQSTVVLDRWRQPGDITQVPRALFASSSVAGNSPTDGSSRFIEDGSFLRLRNVTLAYNFSDTVLDRIKMSSARVYVSGQNLWTLTNYSGYDPENQNLGTGVPILGVDYLNQPQPRTISLGLNLGF